MTMGHNSGDVLQKDAQTELKSIIERWERILVDRAEVMETLKELRAESKGRGYDNKAIAALIKIRAADRAKRQEELAILHLYAQAAGMDESLI